MKQFLIVLIVMQFNFKDFLGQKIENVPEVRLVNDDDIKKKVYRLIKVDDLFFFENKIISQGFITDEFGIINSTSIVIMGTLEMELYESMVNMYGEPKNILKFIPTDEKVTTNGEFFNATRQTGSFEDCSIFDEPILVKWESEKLKINLQVNYINQFISIKFTKLN